MPTPRGRCTSPSEPAPGQKAVTSSLVGQAQSARVGPHQVLARCLHVSGPGRQSGLGLSGPCPAQSFNLPQGDTGPYYSDGWGRAPPRQKFSASVTLHSSAE